MATQSLVKKLLLKAGDHAAILNPPAGYLEQLVPLPDGVEVGHAAANTSDFVQVFVNTMADVDRDVPGLLRILKPKTRIWISYRKGGAKAGTDLNRDILRVAIEQHGWCGVSMIAIDDTWSALRFRPCELAQR